jgi:hypothetical protein
MYNVYFNDRHVAIFDSYVRAVRFAFLAINEGLRIDVRYEHST